jgi:ribulose-phosphate 3-epimerase
VCFAGPIQFSPSILAADFSNLAQAVREMEKAGAASIHIDMMDGHYVHNFTFGLDLFPALRRHTALPLIAHLEIDNPDAFIADFARVGAAGIIVCEDTCPNLKATIQQMRSMGVQVGVSLNPDRPLSLVQPYLEQIDQLIILSVWPGFGGQPFDPLALPKIEAARSLLNQLPKPPALAVDGGINQDNIAAVVQAGADMLIVGSAVFRGGAIGDNLDHLRRLILPSDT